MKIVAIVQARVGSTRLPGKVLLDLAGEPMLARVVDRLQGARRLDEVIIATTTMPQDDAIIALCEERGWRFFRGDEHDVLDRYYHAARARTADVVVRITSDCPLIDAGVVDDTIAAFLERQPALDYAVNGGFPRGLDTEVISAGALNRAWREASDPALREHVTAHIYRHPSDYRLFQLTHEPDLSHLRWTVDTPEDFQVAELIFRHFQDTPFSWREALALWEQHPEWQEINRDIQQKVV